MTAWESSARKTVENCDGGFQKKIGRDGGTKNQISRRENEIKRNSVTRIIFQSPRVYKLYTYCSNNTNKYKRDNIIMWVYVEKLVRFWSNSQYVYNTYIGIGIDRFLQIIRWRRLMNTRSVCILTNKKLYAAAIINIDDRELGH